MLASHEIYSAHQKSKSYAGSPPEQAILLEAVRDFRRTVYITHHSSMQIRALSLVPPDTGTEVLGHVLGLYPEWLGDRSFQHTHQVRFPYICGEMANGIAGTRLVLKAVNSGLLSFFGAAGLALSRVQDEISHIQSQTSLQNWGVNLIHTPDHPEWEQKLVELCLQKKVKRLCASAFMKLTPAVVQYACTGLQEEHGRIVRAQHLFAKISRPELARMFMSPPPESLLRTLVEQKKLTEQEALLATRIPLAEDITAEADSAGHTDNQVLGSLFPSLLELKYTLETQYKYLSPIRLGAAGGIGSPQGAAAAFSMGAAYIVTGSVNQSCVEADLHASAKKLLANLQFGDTMMCAASDMFEKGVKLQVLKKGSLYGIRANWLYKLYKEHAGLRDLPDSVVRKLEEEIFQMPLEEVWLHTRQFWLGRDPIQVQRAEKDSKHHMALIFRYYLGLSSKWAIAGLNSRLYDYQIWTGPAQASFNTWVKGSFLETVENRTIDQVAFNILEGAAQVLRAQQLRNYGLPISPEAFLYRPKKLQIERDLQGESVHVH